MEIVQTLGMVAAAAMPLWNIPLMARIIRRKSSADISKAWVFGVWGCILLMTPSGIVSSDPVLKTFTLANLVFFSGVVCVVMMYQGKGSSSGSRE